MRRRVVRPARLLVVEVQARLLDHQGAFPHLEVDRGDVLAQHPEEEQLRPAKRNTATIRVGIPGEASVR
jgi:hypothetical protein